jgi:putative hydrolase of the HAD superfamily
MSRVPTTSLKSLHARAERVVLWDFDGTLAFREGLWGGCLLEILDTEEVGHAITRDQISPLLASGFPWYEPDTPHPELNDPDTWWQMMNAKLTRAFVGLGYSSQRANELASRVRDRYTDPLTFQLFEDAIPTLRELKNKGWTHAILSNHVPELPKIVSRLGLDEFISNVYSSATTGFEKPHPEAYRHALRALGHPEHVWMVGDSVEADVLGAQRVGLPAILARSDLDRDVKYHAKDLNGVTRIVL